jgi:hypothetical protein
MHTRTWDETTGALGVRRLEYGVVVVAVVVVAVAVVAVGCGARRGAEGAPGNHGGNQAEAASSSQRLRRQKSDNTVAAKFAATYVNTWRGLARLAGGGGGEKGCQSEEPNGRQREGGRPKRRVPAPGHPLAMDAFAQMQVLSGLWVRRAADGRRRRSSLGVGKHTHARPAGGGDVTPTMRQAPHPLHGPCPHIPKRPSLAQHPQKEKNSWQIKPMQHSEGVRQAGGVAQAGTPWSV